MRCHADEDVKLLNPIEASQWQIPRDSLLASIRGKKQDVGEICKDGIRRNKEARVTSCTQLLVMWEVSVAHCPTHFVKTVGSRRAHRFTRWTPATWRKIALCFEAKLESWTSCWKSDIVRNFLSRSAGLLYGLDITDSPQEKDCLWPFFIRSGFSYFPSSPVATGGTN